MYSIVQFLDYAVEEAEKQNQWHRVNGHFAGPEQEAVFKAAFRAGAMAALALLRLHAGAKIK